MSFFREQIVKRLTRSSGWSRVRAAFLKANPKCAACGGRASEAHHKLPFHDHPELELDPNNLIGFCRICHLTIGHLRNWRAYNATVAACAAVYRRWMDRRAGG